MAHGRKPKHKSIRSYVCFVAERVPDRRQRTKLHRVFLSPRKLCTYALSAQSVEWTQSLRDDIIILNKIIINNIYFCTEFTSRAYRFISRIPFIQ